MSQKIDLRKDSSLVYIHFILRQDVTTFGIEDIPPRTVQAEARMMMTTEKQNRQGQRSRRGLR